MPAQAMHFRNPRRSIPSWLWSNKIASWFFCSGIFSFPFFPNKVRSRFTVKNRRHTLLFHGNLFWRCGNKTIVCWFVGMQLRLHRSLHIVRPAALAFGAGEEQIVPCDGECAGIPFRGDKACGRVHIAAESDVRLVLCDFDYRDLPTASSPLRKKRAFSAQTSSALIQRIFVTPPNSLHPPARRRRSPRTIHRSPDRPPNPQYPPVGQACRWDAQRFFLAGRQRDREPGQ